MRITHVKCGYEEGKKSLKVVNVIETFATFRHLRSVWNVLPTRTAPISLLKCLSKNHREVCDVSAYNKRWDQSVHIHFETCGSDLSAKERPSNNMSLFILIRVVVGLTQNDFIWSFLNVLIKYHQFRCVILKGMWCTFVSCNYSNVPFLNRPCNFKKILKILWTTLNNRKIDNRCSMSRYVSSRIQTKLPTALTTMDYSRTCI